MNGNNIEALATDIYNWCKKNELWSDCIIYFNGKAWYSNATWNGVDGIEVNDGLYEYEDKNPLDYFEYANPDTLSMSFEGELYNVLNGYCDGWIKLEDKFEALFKKHGYYFELGDSWNLVACEL